MREYPRYIRICADAVSDDTFFKGFRQARGYHKVVEGVPEELGGKYVSYIKDHYSYLLSHMEIFATNDLVGNPKMYYYEDLGREISSVTCRYIKILGDMIELFDTLDNLDIVEIGAGYGGQCKIIHDYCKPRSYTIVDLPEAGKLAKKYLKYFGINSVKFKTPDSIFNEKYSLCISNYAFAEFDRKYQDFYAENIIKKSDKGYMVCNFFGKYTIKEKPDRFTQQEICDLKPTGKVFPEDPVSAECNFLYVW